MTIPNTETCSAAGTLAAGGICAERLTGKTRDLTRDEYFDFLEAAPANPVTGTPAKGAAICVSSDQWNDLQTALDQACRELGSRCKPEVIKAIR